MAKKLILGLTLDRFGPNSVRKNFSWVLHLLDVKHCRKLSLYEISREINEPNIRKWQKKLSFSYHFGPLSPNLGPQFFFRKFYLY